MIRPANECKTEYRENMKGGEGTVRLTGFIASPDELAGKGRLFSKITLDPGCSIGYHVHEGERELFCFLSGTALYNDNGTTRTVRAGDVTICPAGTGHGVANHSPSPVELVAVILNE